ncbi:PstS family phosphate ABC transporter substrate-binding protein [Paenibacillus flagellatus]|uniref:Phosphate-binding protein n=1 Tax=Paenibacillus flagellatus TaxID=2211139 RepID=A0A2V5K8G0_9BACL|nr:substrate-binding domain-containing protein [Paenibacillus flagellatus]PYI55152.1 phosphate-binding protein [Paenibacillus flagellatus]
MNDKDEAHDGRSSVRPPSRGGIAASLLAAAGWAIVYALVYLIVSIVAGIVSDAHAFTRGAAGRLGDGALAAVHLFYLFAIGLLFAAAGCGIAVRSRRRTRFVLLAFVPLTLLGPIVWTFCYRSSEGAMAGFGGFVWFGYMAYAFWAAPLFDYVRHYVPDFTVKYIALAASFVPAAFAAAGAALVPWASRSRARKLRLAGVIAAVPAALAVCFALSAFLPRDYLFERSAYPRVDGATAAVPLGKELAHRLAGVSRPEAEMFVRFNTTHQAYVHLIENKADIIFAAGPSGEERRLAEQRGVRLKLTPVGKDAFVFLVHRDNPVNGLSVGQIRDIYSGAVSNWNQVGGDDAEIAAYQRDPNSGSQTYMETKVMAGAKLAEPPMERRIYGMGGLIDTVAAYSNARHSLGYSFYYFANEMHKREHVKFLAVNGVDCTKDTIRSGGYPFTAVLYAVTREGDPEDGPAARMLSWIVSSEDGRKAIEKGGFIPIVEERE